MRISDWSSDVCSSDLRPVVRRRRHPGEAGHRGGGAGPDGLRAQAVGEDLLRVDAQHPAVVHLAPTLVGPSGAGLVRPGRRAFRGARRRSEEHTSELQSLMRISYAVFCLKTKKKKK